MENENKTTESSMAATVGALLGAGFFMLSVAYAQAEEKAPPAGSEAKPAANKSDAAAPGEVDITDIQNQYWKAHDKEFEVIQNKQYTKAGRVEVTPLFGIYQRVDFQDTKTLGFAGAYHFSEAFGVEAMGYKMFTSDSHTLSQFKAQTGATVDFNQEKYYVGASAMFTPIYGKFSLLGKKISHFDLYIAPGLGFVKTTAMRFAPSVAIGQKFWVSPKWNVRVEYRIMRYNDTVDATTGTFATRNGGAGKFEDTVTDQNLMFGISYLFN